MMISVLLLGPPEVRANGELVPIRRRTTRALLYYLASRGRMVGRDELLTLFWENEPDRIAHRRLRETLSRLRNAFPGSCPIRDEPGLVGLDIETVTVDQLQFQELIDIAGRAAWQIPNEEPLPEQIAQLLQQAYALWRSPCFLAGADLPSTAGLDRWYTRTAQHLEHLQENVLQRLSDHYFVTGDLEFALQLARQALQNNELNEELHYRVLRCLIQLGHRSEAREHFADLQALLRRELDANPVPKLVDLYRQIRENGVVTSRPDTQPAWNVRFNVQTPFIGRRRMLGQLRRLFSNAGGVLISGESGQGKTRLLQEFSALVEPRPRLLHSICRPAENNLPFQPIIELLRYHILPDEWLAFPAAWANQLTLLLPELATMRPDLERSLVDFAPDTPPGQVRALLFEAIRQVFLLISVDQRLLFCVDDAQWIDEASLATLAYLLERPPFDRQALLVIAARTEEKNPHLDSILDSLHQSIRFTTLHLAQFSLEETSELARHALGFTPPDLFVQRLAEETGGNPLYILETLRLVLEQGQSIQEVQPAQLPLSKNLQTLIHGRLQRLTPSQRSFLEIAALIGIEFDPEVARVAGGYNEIEVVNILEALEGHLLIEPLSPTPKDARYHFIHNIIREVLLQKLNPLRTRFLHGKIAKALESRMYLKTANQAAVLAQHFEYAGEASLAFAYWMQASRRARQLFSPSDAIQAFIHARRMIPMASDLTDDQIHSLFDEWNELAYENEDATTIEGINRDLLRLGQERNSPLLTGAALIGMSDASMVGNRFEEGLVYTNQAIPYLEKSGDIYKQMVGYIRRGVFFYMLNRIGVAIESFQDALAIGSDSTDPQVLRARADALYHISIARTLSGWPESGLNHALRSLADFRMLNRAHGTVTAYSALALSRYLTGDLLQAREDSLRGIELAGRINAWRMLGYLHTYLGMIELSLGDTDSALIHVDQAIELGGKYKHNEILSAGYRILGDIYNWLMAPEKAAEYYQLALQASNNQFLAADPMFRLGFALCLTGETESGQALLNTASHISLEAGLGVLLVLTELAQATLHVMHEEWDQAYQLTLNVHKDTLRRGMKPDQLTAIGLLGKLALQKNDVSRALQYFQKGAREAAALSLPWNELTLQRKLETALKRSGLPFQDTRQRIILLLDELQRKAQNERVAQAFENFRLRTITD